MRGLNFGVMRDPNDIITGGVCYGNLWLYSGLYIKAPWASLVVSPEELVIKVDAFIWRRSFTLPKGYITSLRRRKVLFWRGVQVLHTCHAPRYIVFFPLRTDIFTERLQHYGYEIEA